jgi:hypothetical protein
VVRICDLFANTPLEKMKKALLFKEGLHYPLENQVDDTAHNVPSILIR